MKTIWSIFTVLTLSILFLAFASTIATEAGQKNPNLDNESEDMIFKLNYEYSENYNGDTIKPGESSVTANSTFEGTDAFIRQYLEDKSEIAQKKSTLDKVGGIPDLVLNSMGIQNDTLVTSIKLMLSTIIIFLISLALYKAVRTGEVD